MRVRYKAPSGTGTLTFEDDITVKDVLDGVKTATGIHAFSVKYGPPMAMKTIDPSEYDSVAKSIGLNGETLTVVPDEARAITPPPVSAGKEAQATAPQQSQKNPAENPEDISVPWPEREGTMCKCTSSFSLES